MKIILFFILSIFITFRAWTEIPIGSVSFFTTSVCPQGWKEVPSAYGRAIMGTTDASEVGKTEGIPISNDRMYLSMKSIYIGDFPVAKDFPNPIHHPYISFLACEKEVEAKVDSLPFGAVSFFNKTQCPKGWSALDEANNKLIMGLIPQISVGGFSSVNQFSLVEPGVVTDDKSIHVYGMNRTRRDPILINLPYLKLFICEKKEFVNVDVNVNPDLNVFFGAHLCPTKWRRTIGTSGRFIIAHSKGQNTVITDSSYSIFDFKKEQIPDLLGSNINVEVNRELLPDNAQNLDPNLKTPIILDGVKKDSLSEYIMLNTCQYK